MAPTSLPATWGILDEVSLPSVCLAERFAARYQVFVPRASVYGLVVDTTAYLNRIGLDSAPPIDLASLEVLQRAHLTHVPFENLDVFYRRGVHVDPIRSASKIVEQGRGGWCFELNGAFSLLLADLGFEVTKLGATVVIENRPTIGPQPSHATIRVDLDRPYLVDVGFGDSFFRPLPLDNDGPHDGGHAFYSFACNGDTTTLLMEGADAWEPQYHFSPNPAAEDDFEGANEFLQTLSMTHFTEKPFATRLFDGGPDRVTLLDDRLKLRSDGVLSESLVASDDWPAVLEKWFGMMP